MQSVAAQMAVKNQEGQYECHHWAGTGRTRLRERDVTKKMGGNCTFFRLKEARGLAAEEYAVWASLQAVHNESPNVSVV
jgi:hypothetical protein